MKFSFSFAWLTSVICSSWLFFVQGRVSYLRASERSGAWLQITDVHSGSGKRWNHDERDPQRSPGSNRSSALKQGVLYSLKSFEADVWFPDRWSCCYHVDFKLLLLSLMYSLSFSALVESSEVRIDILSKNTSKPNNFAWFQCSNWKRALYLTDNL